jgi:hypothetical protein
MWTRSEVLAAVTTKIIAQWYATPCMFDKNSTTFHVKYLPPSFYQIIEGYMAEESNIQQILRDSVFMPVVFS